MPFWKKDKAKENGKSKEKVNYKSRLEHKQYLVRQFSFSPLFFCSRHCDVMVSLLSSFVLKMSREC